jgi:hypothetical protein
MVPHPSMLLPSFPRRILTQKFLESKVFTLGSSRLADYGERR